MADHELVAFTKGVHNLLSDEIIPVDAASDASNFYTQDGKIKLSYGRLLIGAEGAVGAIYGGIFGYKVDGTKVQYRKTGTKIQYFNGTTWTDIVTGLTATADYTFANYSSLAGAFTFAFGVDGIYKMHSCFPTSYISLYNATYNFKGHAFIDRGRTILWNRTEDKTGLYGSKIDRQDSTVYTSVSGEATTSLGGTLAFKGATTRNCFGVTITLTVSGEVYTDNYLGVLTGSLGGTGTINYMTGVYTLTNAGVGTAAYQWEDSNAAGVTDFRKSATRLAGEGFVFPQDEGGDAIKRVLIGLDGAYYSLKSQSAYRLEIGPTDLASDAATSNLVYRREMGVPSMRAGVSMSKGIVFMNTANSEKPELTLLQRNPIGGEVEPLVLFPQFKFSNYNYDDCTIETYERYILVMCRSATAPTVYNDTILLCNLGDGTVDITNYSARVAISDGGDLYIGSSITESTYQLYSGFDDDGLAVDNHWDSKNELFDRKGYPTLKKVRKLRLRGHIDPAQNCEVYANYDDAGWQLVGTIRGDGTYVDASDPFVVGVSMVGTSQIGADVTTTTFPYFIELKLKNDKFRKRKIRLKCTDIGYFDCEMLSDIDITHFENRIPKRFRSKQNVSLDGTQTDLENPEY